MNIDQIRDRLFTLRDEINTLAAMLPEDARLSFGTVFLTGPDAAAHRKRLVVTLEADQRDRDNSA